MEEEPRQQELEEKKLRLEELMTELGGLDYVKQNIEEDLKKVQQGGGQGMEKNVQSSL